MEKEQIISKIRQSMRFIESYPSSQRPFYDLSELIEKALSISDDRSGFNAGIVSVHTCTIGPYACSHVRFGFTSHDSVNIGNSKKPVLQYFVENRFGYRAAAGSIWEVDALKKKERQIDGYVFKNYFDCFLKSVLWID